MTSLKGWLSAAHPLPLALIVALTALVGIASTDGEPDAARMALILLAMALSQFAIGWSNDYLDRETDAAQQPWKPLPAGLVRESQMPLAIAAVLLGSLVAGALLGPGPLSLLIAGTACGLAYNLWLKDTPVSAVPFIVALALLPAYVWKSLDVYEGDFLWLYAIGVPLALAAHLANTLPDIEGDAAAGRRGLAVRLGRGWTIGLIEAGMVAPLFVALARIASVDAYERSAEFDWEALRGVLVSYAVVCVAIAVYYAMTSSRGAAVWGFRLVAIAGVCLATGWLAAA
jgi:4-hydroxybenzoate polyprenyltransferase